VQKVHENICIGHIVGNDENRIANSVLHGRVEGTPRRGHPRTTWLKSTLAARYEV